MNAVLEMRIAGAVERSKREILADIEQGTVPQDVKSFTELHDHVDANEYGGLCNENADLDLDSLNAIQSAVDAWLRARRVAITVITFDASDVRVDEAECDCVESALLAARTLVADYFDGLQSRCAAARMSVRFLVDGRVVQTFTDRQLR
jgi:hypothetical protein